MKIPKEIVTRNKIRDFQICRLYVYNHLTMEEIGSRFGISGSRVQQLIYKNRHLLNLDKDYEKAKRVNWLQRQIKKRSDSKKDSADLVEQLRREIEGDKPTIDQSRHIHITSFNEFINDAYRGNGKANSIRDGAEDTSRLPS